MKKLEKYMVIATVVLPSIFGIVLFSNTGMVSTQATFTESEAIQQAQVLETNQDELITDLKDANDNLSLEVQQLRIQLEAQSHTSLANPVSDNSDLKKQLDSLEAENSKISKENRDLEKEISKLSSSSKTTQPSKTEVKSFKDKISQLEKDLKNEKSQKKRIDRSEAEKRLKGDLDKSLRVNQELKNEVKKLKEEVKKLEDKIKN